MCLSGQPAFEYAGPELNRGMNSSTVRLIVFVTLIALGADYAHHAVREPFVTVGQYHVPHEDRAPLVLRVQPLVTANNSLTLQSSWSPRGWVSLTLGARQGLG